MSVLAIGLSHRSAPVALLERAAGAGDPRKLLAALRDARHVEEAVVLSTCNRFEVYAEVSTFHGGVQELTEVLATESGLGRDTLAPHLYVHYEGRAVAHLFSVVSGLDSMVVGESQILGQVRSAFRTCRDEKTIGRVLDPLFQQALRVGKRVHAETGIDRAGPSVAGAGLAVAGSTLGGLAGRSTLVVGAGAMGALVVASLHREGSRIVVANRTPRHAARLVRQVGGRAVGLEALEEELAAADLLVSSTGATGLVIGADVVAAAMTRRPGRPLVILDLALPRDVDPAVRELAGVTLVDLESLHAVLEGTAPGREVESARLIVAEEVAAFVAWQRASRVAPTVAALRSKADEVVSRELARLDGRLTDLPPRTRAEIAATVHRVVEKLLHTPTVRVKQLAEGPDGDAYAEALRELFGLDPATPQAVAQTDFELTGEQP